MRAVVFVLLYGCCGFVSDRRSSFICRSRAELTFTVTLCCCKLGVVSGNRSRRPRPAGSALTRLVGEAF